MDLTEVIKAIKERCPSYEQRVGGAAEFTSLPEKTVLPVPAAFVIPMDDDASANASSNGWKQNIWDRIAVVVAIDNTPDERGQTAIYSVKAVRKELFAALLAWEPDDEHGRIEYDGGQLLRMDRARLWYQFEFRAETEIGEADTWQGHVNENLGPLNKIGVKVDLINPSITGEPDGNPEAEIVIDVPQN